MSRRIAFGEIAIAFLRGERVMIDFVAVVPVLVYLIGGTADYIYLRVSQKKSHLFLYAFRQRYIIRVHARKERITLLLCPSDHIIECHGQTPVLGKWQDSNTWVRCVTLYTLLQVSFYRTIYAEKNM